MKLLLDTHAFIWWDKRPRRLSSKALNAIMNSEADVFFSMASVWEMQIKHTRGKLILGENVRDSVERQVRANGVKLLQIASEHVWELERLPPIHGDPFDRLLVAQARVEGMKLVTSDDTMKRYEVQTLW